MRKVIGSNELPSREEMLAWIQALSAGPHRLPGTPEGLRAEALLERWFREAGLEDVTREPVALDSWIAGESRIECQGGSFPAYPISRSRFTGPEGVRGLLLPVGQGEPDALDGRSLEGRIAVVEVGFAPRPYAHLRKAAHAVHDPGATLAKEPSTRATWILPTFARAYASCAARRAAGMVAVLRDLRANRHRYHYPYATGEEVLPVPGAFLGAEDGRRLLQVLAREPAEGRLVTTGRTERAVTHNVLGFLPGASDGLILVTSHHDSPFRGSVDDASGLAQLLAIARHFGRRSRAERPLSMLFLAAGGNYLRNLGATSFLARHAHDLVPRIALAVTLEHVGSEVEERGGRLVETGRVEPRGIFVSDRHDLLDVTTLAVVGNDLRRSFVVPVPSEGVAVDGEARPYFAAGLPVIGFASGPEYVLTDDDGMSLVAADELVPVAKTFIEVLWAFLDLQG